MIKSHLNEINSWILTTYDHNHKGRNAVIYSAAIVRQSTCQMYQWTDEDKGDFIANGCIVLFQHNGSKYCFSCAHVLADAQCGKTFFLTQSRIAATIGGHMFHSEPVSSERRVDDALDFAVAKLNKPVYDCLLENGYVFIDLSRIIIVPQLSQEDGLLVFGFPATKTEIDAKTSEMKFKALILTTCPDLDHFKEENYTKGFHHIVKYRINSLQETSTKSKMRGPNPEGISGSGLWLFARNGVQLPVPLLIGILSEYHENRAVLISTKVDIFLEVIRQQFDPTISHDGVELEIKNPDLE